MIKDTGNIVPFIPPEVRCAPPEQTEYNRYLDQVVQYNLRVLDIILRSMKPRSKDCLIVDYYHGLCLRLRQQHKFMNEMLVEIKIQWWKSPK